MKRKDAAAYNAVYNEVVDLLGNVTQQIDSVVLITDGEINLYECLNSAFAKKDVPVQSQLCTWHFSRNIICALATCGLATTIRKGDGYDRTFSYQFWMIRNLFLLPPSAIIPSIKYIRARSDKRFNKFYDYLEKKLAKDGYVDKLSWVKYLSTTVGYLTDNQDTTGSRSENLHKR